MGNNPTTDYAVRRLRPEDARSIPELTERVNGPGYIHAELYHPDRLLRLNASGELLSAVVVHISGGVVGHLALERPDLGPIAESGEAMVLPEHQHHHLLDRMKSFLDEEGRRLGLAGIFGNAVTHHVFSQLAEERAKSTPTAFLLAASPAQAHRISGAYPQRVSLLSYFKYLREAEATMVCLPARHRGIVTRIYELPGRQARFEAPTAPCRLSDLSTSYEPSTQRGVITVNEPGKESAAQIEQARRSLLIDSGAAAIFVELPVDRPASARLCEEAEELGFFFSGIIPRAGGSSDRLRLQFCKEPVDLSLLQINGQFARDMLSYIGAERQRVEH